MNQLHIARNWIRIGLVACAVLLLTRPAQAARNTIAILPLDVQLAEGHLDKAARVSMEEMLRDVTTTALSSFGWNILSGENTLEVLRDNGIDPAHCGEQSCHLAAAREMNARMFVSGSVQYSDKTFTASIRLIDTVKGQILASERLEAKNAKGLRRAFERRANGFFDRAGLPHAKITPTVDESERSESSPSPKTTTPARDKLSPATAALGEALLASMMSDKSKAMADLNRLNLVIERMAADTGADAEACFTNLKHLAMDEVPSDNICGELRSCAISPPGYLCWGGPYIARLAPDPWGSAYLLKHTGTARYSIYSKGPDKVLGTADDLSVDGILPHLAGPKRLFPRSGEKNGRQPPGETLTPRGAAPTR